MGNTDFDHIQFKNDMKNSWNNVANGWKKWWAILEKGAQPASDMLIKMANLQEGHYVLDIATGIGEPAVSAANIIGSTGKIIATDQASQMLAIAKERSLSLDLSNIDFQEGDCEHIDYPDETFNAILCRWGFMFLPDLQGTLKKLYNMLVKGGILSAAVWDFPHKVPMISLSLSTARKVLSIPPSPINLPNPFSLADTDELKKKFHIAGFKNIQINRLTLKYQFESAETYTQFTKEISAPVATLITSQNHDKQLETWKAITDEAQKYSTDGKTIQLPAESIFISGQK